MASIKVKRLTGRRLIERNTAFKAENPLCVHCQQERRVTPATEIDHIIPLHKGGPDEWDNLQGLCKPHHQEKTNRDMGSRKTGCDEQGNPLNPSHPWNQQEKEMAERAQEVFADALEVQGVWLRYTRTSDEDQ